MKKGLVVIEFSISKDGKVQGMKLAFGSGDITLDRAAWGAIANAAPLPNLPAEFAGDSLKIRTRFYYNPDKNICRFLYNRLDDSNSPAALRLRHSLLK